MKKLSILTTLIFLLTYNAQSQDCDALLKDGLYSITSMTETGSFDQDIKTYFLSDQFKSSLENGDWGASVTIPVDNNLVTLGADYSESEYQNFRSRIMNYDEFSISREYYEVLFKSIPNTNLYSSYNECRRIEQNVSMTGFIEGEHIISEDTAVFVIYYRPQSPNDPMPIVESFNVIPTGSIISGELSVGESLNSYSVTITANRHQDRDLVLNLNTDRGPFITKIPAEGGLSSSRGVPIGTIVASSLNYEQFMFTTKSNEKSPGGIWTASRSRWVPCDGRSIGGSNYEEITSNPNAPDLRGVFLRGLNSFDPYYTVDPKNSDQLNPDNTSALQYQSDAYEKHRHSYDRFSHALNGSGSNIHLGNSDKAFQRVNTTWEGEEDETRPKNVSIYYYMKINN